MLDLPTMLVGRHATVRLREVATRGLKSEESAIITGLRLYHNFVRSHLGLEGEMTPGEVAGIIIESKDKWKTMIQAAAKRRSLESDRVGWWSVG